MATNPYFTAHNSSFNSQQRLLEDLIVQFVEIHGIDAYYVPRDSDISIFNNMLGEQPDTSLTTAYPIEIYLTNFEGYDGLNEYISKFNLEIRSSTNVVMTARSWRRYVAISDRPREGDLIYIPLLNRLFEIKHSDPDVNFHSFGRRASNPYYWELRLEQFKYSQENISTGIGDIDQIEDNNAYRIHLLLNTGSGNYTIGEEVYQGSNYLTANASATVADWNPTDKVLSIINVYGEMSTNANVIGVTSGTSYNLTSYDPYEDHVPDDDFTNAIFNDEALNIVVTTEVNPLANN